METKELFEGLEKELSDKDAEAGELTGGKRLNHGH